MLKQGNKKGIEIDLEWKEVLKDYFETSEWQKLSEFVRGEYLNKDKRIFPEAKNVFKAFNLTPFSKVKIVILGQDPYHDDKQANGLCFSVSKGLTLPPSLKNIYKEIEADLNTKKDFTDEDLESWAEQGIFLLNSILTVVAHMPASHKDKGWEKFTDQIIKTLSSKRQNLVFLLWGNYAKSKKVLIDTNKHLVLEAPHPSPFSVHTGFFGCKHFSKCNEYLKKNKIKEIDW